MLELFYIYRFYFRQVVMISTYCLLLTAWTLL